MEILSDTMFRGATTFKKDVTIDGGDFSLTVPGKSVPLVTTKLNITEFSISGVARIRGSLQLDNNTITRVISCSGAESSYSINLPSDAGTLALTSQIPTVPSMACVARVCDFLINFNVAADCTRFYVDRTPNLPYGPASLQMFTDRLPNGGTGYYLKNVDLGVEKIDMGNPYVFVEKSSSFAISASDGYSIRLVYAS